MDIKKIFHRRDAETRRNPKQLEPQMHTDKHRS